MLPNHYMFIAGLFLGIIWCIFLCIVFLFLCIKLYNKINNKTESKRFKTIFKFILKSCIPFFIVLFVIGNKSIMFADPKLYICGGYNILYSNAVVYDNILRNEIMQENKKLEDCVLSNGYKLIHKKELIKFFNLGLYKNIYFYIDSNNKKHIISISKGCNYTNYGIWLMGDEGSGIRWQFKFNFSN